MGFEQRLTSARMVPLVAGSVLAGCGLTTRNEVPQEVMPQPEADAGCDGNADAASDCPVEPPEPSDQSCAYPAAPVDDPPELDSVASLRQDNCVYRLGPPIELPFESGYSRYAFSFDVNGDTIGDVFSYESSSQLGLAVSRVSNGQLFYDRVDCEALDAGYFNSARTFVRDMNRDGVPDLIVGVGSTAYPAMTPPGPSVGSYLTVLTNSSAGFIEAARYEWPEPTKATVLDVAVGDFDGNNSEFLDFAVGYDRVTVQTIEVGVLVFRSMGSEPSQSYETQGWATLRAIDLSTPFTEPLYTGQIAAGGQLYLGEDTVQPLYVVENGPDEPGGVNSSLLILWRRAELTEESVQVTVSDIPSGNRSQAPLDAWILPFAGTSAALFLPYQEELLIHDLTDPSVSPLPVLLNHPLLVVHGEGHGLGAGPDNWVRGLLDVDGDGDLELIEYGYQGSTMVIHRNEDNMSFADGITFEIGGLERFAEHPFIAAGASEAALIVNYPSGEYGSGPPTVQPLWCD